MSVTTTTVRFVPLLLFYLLTGYSSSFAITSSDHDAAEYQTLVVGSLPVHPSLDPHLDADRDLDLAWTADPESLLGDDEPAAAFSEEDDHLQLRLHHLDTLLPSNSTPDQLFHLRLRRDAARVASIQHSVTLATTTPQVDPSSHKPNRIRNIPTTPADQFNSSVVSGLAQGSGEYFTRIAIGTPPEYAYMVLDTGSDVVWIQCSPCRRCYAQADPVFDPKKSRTYAAVPCASVLCRRLDVSGCDSRRQSCLYQVSYGDGSLTAGEFATETLTFRGGVRVQRVAFGCGHDNEGLFVAAAGLLGLGRGSLSFPTQAGRRYGRRFSYCLVDRTSSVGLGVKRTSTLLFGTSAVPAPPVSALYTPLLSNPRLDTFYYVELRAISVGGTRVPGVLFSDLRLDPATGRGGVIVDSGTSVSRLRHRTYAALRDAFRAGTAGLPPAPGFSLFDTCFDLSGKTEVKVPTVVFHFAPGPTAPAAAAGRKTVNLSLPASNYLIPVDTKGIFCLAFAATEGSVSIIGNIQQQGFRVVYDGAASRVGFTPRGC